MSLSEIPGRVDPSVRQEVERCWRRARFGLHATSAVCWGQSAVAVVLALVSWGSHGVSGSVVTLVLALAPLFGAEWVSRRAQDDWRLKSFEWWQYPVLVGFFCSMALMYGLVSAGYRSAFGAPHITVPAACFVLGIVLTLWAHRTLVRRPSLIAGSEFWVRLAAGAARQMWFNQDFVTVTGATVILEARSGAGRVASQPARKEIPLDSVSHLGVRASRQDDPPWAWLADGRGLPVPPGDVVCVRTRDDEHLIPVVESEALESVISGRVRMLSGRAPQALAVNEAAARAEDVTAEHVPEVRPAPSPTGQAATRGRVVRRDLPSGPGLPARWAASLVLGVGGVVAVPAFVTAIATGSLAGTPGGEDVRAGLAMTGWAWLWIAAATLAGLGSRRCPRRWPWLAVLSAAPTAVALVVTGSIDGLPPFTPLGLPPWQAAFALLLVGPTVAAVARVMWTRVPGTDLGSSGVEYPVSLASGASGRLLVGRDSLVLDSRPSGHGGHVRHAMPLSELALAQAGQVVGPAASWPFPGGTSLRLGDGPVVRLVSGQQQWLVPVTDPQLLIEVVMHRASRASNSPGTVESVDAWRELRAWAARATTTVRRGQPRQARENRWLVAGLLAALAGTAILALTAGRFVDNIMLWGVGGLTVLASALVMGFWWRRRSRMRIAQFSALPPGSPAWGELRADRAPLTEYQIAEPATLTPHDSMRSSGT